MDLRTVASPNRYHRRRDEESAGAGEERGGGSGEICSPSDAFDIPAKNVPVERLRRWRVSSSTSEPSAAAVAVAVDALENGGASPRSMSASATSK